MRCMSGAGFSPTVKEAGPYMDVNMNLRGLDNFRSYSQGGLDSYFLPGSPFFLR